MACTPKPIRRGQKRDAAMIRHLLKSGRLKITRFHDLHTNTVNVYLSLANEPD